MRLLALLAVLGIAHAVAQGPVTAQAGNLRFRSWGLDDGMPHDAIYALHQDRAGLIWVGTQDGLLRFDGERFDVLRHEPADPSSLSDDYVAAIHDDGEGGLWVGTVYGWLNRVDLGSGLVTRVQPPGDSQTGGAAAIGRAVYEIAEGGAGHLLLATDVGPLLFDRSTGGYEALDATMPVGAGHATAVFAEPGGVVWIGYGGGQVRRATLPAGASDSVVTIQATFELAAEVSSIERGPDGRLWIATRGRGVFALDDLGGPQTRLHSGADARQRLLHDRVQDIHFDIDGSLWVATIEGLSVFPAGGGAPDHFVEDDSDTASLPDRLCIVLLEDRQGVIWIGTLSGLARLHPSNRAFARYVARRPTRDGIGGGGALAIAEAGRGRIWVGTMGGGLDRLDLADGSVIHYPPDPTGTAGPRHGEVKSLAMHPSGVLWIATMGGGVGRLDPATGRFEHVAMEPSAPNVDTRLVPAVYVDGQGTVWASTQFDGLHRFLPGEGVFRRYRGPDDTWDFGSDYAWPILEDVGGNLWLGAFEGGLVRISPDRLTAVLHARDNSDLPSDRILTLHEGTAGQIWVGTEGNGLIRFDPRTESFVSYTTDHGLPHDNVEGILSDRAGNLWISTNDGLARMDQSGAFTSFSPNVGLHGRRFYANSALALPDGRLAFGGEQGLTVVSPDRLRNLTDPSPVVLTGFTVGGELRPVTPEQLEGRIELAASENFFAFRFTALDYADPEAVEYRYRLDPLDASWTENGNSRVANYTSVPPDEYVFRVSARNSVGVWSEDALGVRLIVHPPIYATLWFRSLVLAALTSLLTAAYVFRVRQLHRVHEVRFGTAGELHDEIGINLVMMANRTRAVRESAGLNAENRAKLDAIDRILRETTERVRDTVWMVRSDYDNLPDLLSRLHDTADTVLDGAVTYSVTMPVDPPDQTIRMEVRQCAYRLFKEALHNVTKHARAKHVDIVVGYDRPILSVMIRDDGQGFDPAAGHSGNGVSLMRQRAARHAAAFEITSAPGRGTTVQFSLRLR